jgi:hypothetical protein
MNGTVGTANQVYGEIPQLQMPEGPKQDYSQLMEALAKKQMAGKATGSAPIQGGKGQASATGQVVPYGGVTTQGAPSAMGSASTWVAPAMAMAGLVKAGDKLKIGAKDQAHLYSKLLKKFTGMF